MNVQYLSVEEFDELIKQWSGKTVKITKEELGDLDTVIMKLDNVSYSKDTRRLDEYEPMHSVIFNGTGMTETNPQQMQSLPSSNYEVPLEDSTRYQFDNTRFHLETARGTYTIELFENE